MQSRRAVRIGVISDTHNRLRPQVLERLAGCERILHAGDVGDLEILDRLRGIAPVEAVRGNNDYSDELPERLEGDLAGLPFGMVHQRQDMDRAWPRRLRLVVFGHTHRPEMEWVGRCLLLNPGACGARRFSYPLTLAILTVTGERIIPEILAVE